MNFVDIHSHILPGVDDGAGSIDETIAMLKAAYESGTKKIVATPHMFHDLFDNNDFVETRDKFDELIEELESYQAAFPFLSEIQVCSGAENYASPAFLKALDEGCVLTLNRSRYLLVETAFLLPFSQIEILIQRVHLAGFTPVLAHPERYGSIQEDPKRLVKLWDSGCICQINADSLLGASGSLARKCGETLLKEGLVDTIASDGHKLEWRTPELKSIFEKLKGGYAEEDVQAWLVENPECIVENEALEIEVLVETD